MAPTSPRWHGRQFRTILGLFDRYSYLDAIRLDGNEAETSLAICNGRIQNGKEYHQALAYYGGVKSEEEISSTYVCSVEDMVLS